MINFILFDFSSITQAENNTLIQEGKIFLKTAPYHR